ncbi:MAG TPA: hypothetical protein DCY25_05945, partial [Bacteroidales bacterium]|nr:hypothetical protein [Bacteroidales bacterium]
MTAWILKSSLSLIILFGLYWFLLRKEKLFIFNRYFLVLSVVFSLIVPLISIPVNFQVTPQLKDVVTVPGNLIPAVSSVHNDQQYTEMKPSEINITAILFSIYISGVILFLFRLLRNIYIMVYKIKSSEKISNKGFRIVLTNDKTGPCCFFRNIFLNRDDYFAGRIDKALLDHEKEHARQSHTIDIILIELLKTVYWFNPVYILYDRAIRINHEYLADNGVIRDKSDIKSYADKLLDFITCKNNLSLTSGSNQSFTRMRLTMMMKPRSKGAKIGTRITMTLCTVLVLFMLLSFKESDDLQSSPVVPETVTGMQGNSIRGIVSAEDGKPLMLATIIVAFPGTNPTNIGVQSDYDGHFVLKNIRKDASLLVS